MAKLFLQLVDSSWFNMKTWLFPSWSNLFLQLFFQHGEPGHNRLNCRQGELDPKLRELGVPVYFAGHDHSAVEQKFDGEPLWPFQKGTAMKHLGCCDVPMYVVIMVYFFC